jgi:hypothetical protein
VKRKYQIIRRRNSGYWSEAARSVSLQVSLADLATAAREGMHDLMERLGLELMAKTIEQERAALTEGPERVGYKWGSQPGFTFMNGRKVPLAKFQEDAAGRVAFRDLMRGVSTRNYAEGVEGFLHGYGVEKSSVSRQFVRASEEKLRELMERDLSKLDLAAVFIDGIGFADHLLIGVLPASARSPDEEGSHGRPGGARRAALSAGGRARWSRSSSRASTGPAAPRPPWRAAEAA